MPETRMLASIHQLRKGLLQWVVAELRGKLPMTEDELLGAFRLVESMTLGLVMVENALTLGTVEMLSSEMRAFLLKDNPSRAELRRLIVQDKILSKEG